MSDLPENIGEPLDEGQPTEPSRAASVTLRGEGARTDQPLSLDPAQKSLADALRITFFLLQIGMIVLAGLFVLSGARQIREAERGVKLFLGRIVDQNVQPGLRFAWPYPIGEFVTVETGQVSLDVTDSFYPRMTESQKKQPLDNLRLLTRAGLNPAMDGALITGDGNIVHARWTVVYRRSDPGAFVENIYPGSEREMVQAAIERGVVRTIAETPIDSVLKQATATPTAAPAPGEDGAASPPVDAPSEPAPEQVAPPDAETEPATPAVAAPTPVATGAESSIGLRVREIAQQMLDEMQSGIVIERVVMVEPTPPLPVRSNFNNVQAAQSTAEKEREQAEKQRREVLNAVAGAAHPSILEKIDEYEAAIELEDEARAEAILAEIDAILEGQQVASAEQRSGAAISGEAANIISSARQYRTQVVSSSRLSVETFRAKLEQYRANPALLLSREWTDAYTYFLSGPTTQVMLLPRQSMLELWLNSDPDVAKAIEEAKNAAQIEQSILDRERQFQNIRRQTQRMEEGVDAE